jgi:phospholipid transport system transporter-binding protein
MAAATAIVRDGDVLRVTGPVTMETAGALAATARTLSAAAGTGAPRTLDLADATVVDSAAVSLILELARSAGSGGAPLAIAHPPASVASLAALYGVTELVG